MVRRRSLINVEQTRCDSSEKQAGEVFWMNYESALKYSIFHRIIRDKIVDAWSQYHLAFDALLVQNIVFHFVSFINSLSVHHCEMMLLFCIIFSKKTNIDI